MISFPKNLNGSRYVAPWIQLSTATMARISIWVQRLRDQTARLHTARRRQLERRSNSLTSQSLPVARQSQVAHIRTCASSEISPGQRVTGVQERGRAATVTANDMADTCSQMQ
eukprot:3009667-Rhodomonas_salina.1